MESEVLFSITALSLAVLIPVVLTIFSLRFPPSWKDKGPLAPYWFKINVGSLAASSLVGIGTYFLHQSSVIEYQSLAVFSATVITFIFGQTLFTDFSQRLADRRVLRIAIASSFAIGLWFLSEFDSENIPVYLIFSIVAFALLFIPAIGDSDGRAAILIVSAALPVITATGIVNLGIFSIAILLLIYALVVSIMKKDLKNFFVAKLSVPLVPIALAPFIPLIAFASYLPVR